jgi:hypothetical protein
MSDEWEAKVKSMLNELADRLANMSHEQLKEQLPIMRQKLTIDAEMAKVLVDFLDGVEEAFAISDSEFQEFLKRNKI